MLSAFVRRLLASVFFILFALAWLGVAAPRLFLRQAVAASFQEVLVYDVQSKFSHIRVKDYGAHRTLYFVRDSGEEVVESSMDLRSPYLLQVAYTRTMFANFLLKARQQSCLIVGLGGGSMVQFLNHFFPDVKVDAVEIDPVVVAIARTYFGTKAGKKTKIFTEDAFSYLKRTAERYDVIYMDAFLKPSESTDVTGAPRRLKTVAFLKSLHGRLQDSGLVVFNLNENAETEADIRSIREAFPSVYVFDVRGSGNIVVVGSLSHARTSDAELRKRGETLDRQQNYGFSFRAMVDELRR
jgi:spermidine synthase